MTGWEKGENRLPEPARAELARAWMVMCLESEPKKYYVAFYVGVRSDSPLMRIVVQ